MGQKIAILGTSNSLKRDGWAPFFHILHPEIEVRNFSCGSNSSAYGNLALALYDIVGTYDFVFIDFALNENGMMAEGSLSKDNAVRFFDGLLGWFVDSDRTVPIVLTFFDQGVLAAQSYPSRDIHLDVCAQYGVPVFDLFSLIAEVNRGGVPEQRLFEDFSHLSEPCAKLLALHLGDVLDQARNVWARRPSRTTRTRFSALTLADRCLGECSRHLRATSIRSHEVVQVGGETPIHCQIPECRVEGIFYFLGEHTGEIVIRSGSSCRRKNLNLDISFGFFLREFHHPVDVDGLECELSGGDAAAAKDDPAPHSAKRPADRTRARTELVALLISPSDQLVLPSERLLAGTCPAMLRTVLLPYDSRLFREQLDALVCLEQVGPFPDGMRRRAKMCFLAATLSGIAPGRALDLVREAMEPEDRNSHKHHLYGRLLLESGRAEEAEGSARRAVALCPAHAESRVLLGRVLAELDQWGEALEETCAARNLEPGNPSYRIHLAEQLKSLGERSQSSDLLRRALSEADVAISMNPMNPLYHYLRGQILLSLNEVDPAVDAFRKAVGLNPNVHDFHFFLAKALVMRGEDREALQSARRALSAAKGETVANFLMLTLLLLKVNKLDQAKVLAARSVETFPDNWETRKLFSHVLALLGDVRGALEQGRKALLIHQGLADRATEYGAAGCLK